MKLIVLGANGGVGREIVRQALGRGHDVIAAVRTLHEIVFPEGARVIQCDVFDAPAVHNAIAGQEAVFCAVGTRTSGPISLYSAAAHNIVAGMRAAGVRRLLFLSNFGVLNERGHGLRQAMLLFLIKRALSSTIKDHRAALDAIAACDIDWTAVRPMALSDRPLTGRYRLALDGLPEKGAEIGRADVAHLMLEAVEQNILLRRAPAIAY